MGNGMNFKDKGETSYDIFDTYGKKLFAQKTITPADWVTYLELAVELIEDTNTSTQDRADIAMLVSSVWFRGSITNNEFLNEIFAEFGDYEIPLTYETRLQNCSLDSWNRIKHMTKEARQLYIETEYGK